MIITSTLARLIFYLSVIQRSSLIGLVYLIKLNRKRVMTEKETEKEIISA